MFAYTLASWRLGVLAIQTILLLIPRPFTAGYLSDDRPDCGETLLNAAALV